jgi:diguanylate cyclase (GGDEF)-like protein
MSLNKQMIIFITAIVLILLLGTFAFNLHNTKNFLQEQLRSHAQDTATSLGLSLSTIPDPEDIASMETMINAVFDGGYYAHISLEDMDKKTIYHKQNAKSMEEVPFWFIKSIHLETPSANAMVQAGWIPIGILNVSSHAGFAYIQLWNTAKNLFVWFLFSAIIAILIAIYIIRIMLQPLRKMEQQADAIVKKEYLIQEALPSTLEFRQVVIAMNAMVQKLKDIFERDAKNAEKLQKLAYQDSVTGLSNRRHFEMIIDSLLDPQQDAPDGVICLLRVNELKEMNDQFGYLTGDEFIKSLSEKLITQIKQEDAIFARLNGTELVALLPRANANQLKEPTDNINNSMPELLKQLKAEETKTSISIAYTDYKPGEKRGALLAHLDFAIEQAELEGKNCSFYYNISKDQTKHDSWEKTLTKAIEEHRFVLFQQTAFSQDNTVHDQELFIRMQDNDGVIRSAGYFMPAVEQLNKTAALDEMVINMTLGYLRTHAETPVIAMNLSKAIIENNTLQNKLISDLSNYTNLTYRLAIELPERLILELKDQSWPFIQKLKGLGVNIGIDHFGASFGSMLYLQDLRPDYVKLDASFSKATENDEQTRDYLSSLCELTGSLDIDVVAMAIETHEQASQMATLGVNFYQGYLYGAPSPLKDQD